MGMSLGGAPAGPAGTGKTETVKDMGRSLGKYVVVFNCSDQMDYRGLGRIYKGLAQSGAWGCFDEFNRIELPVLSVAAQQIAIVLTCKKEKKPTFIFSDGDTVDMDPEFGIFLTMNPGYAGRQELPENLKVNFRTVSMMVPDRAIIMRVKLASSGFLENQMLSMKFFTLYKLCEEQLSKQVHYDFGLRNILSVLRTMGAFKRANPNDAEKTILMRVLRDMNMSKLVDDDEPLFMSLIDDLFPGIKLDKVGYPEIESAIQNQIENSENIVNHKPWVSKIIQLYETQKVRHGMMTLGPSGSGKTTCIRILAKAMSDCGELHREVRMNPKAITAPQMFGRLDVATNDWTDGIFSTLWRKTLKAKKTEHIWLILDGPVDAIWIENLNSVLDDNKTLTLANGDRIPMSPNCKIIFEVHNIDNASPATVSRNGMVFMSSSILTWQPIFEGWLRNREAREKDIFLPCLLESWENSLAFISQNLCPKMNILDCMYIHQLINMLEGIIVDEDYSKSLNPQHLTKILAFSILWSLGALLELDDRKKFEDFLLHNYKILLMLPDIEESLSLYDYLVDNDGNWVKWSSRVPEYQYPKDHCPEYTTILVPNVDNTRSEYLLELISKQKKPVLFIGEQGTAKTVIVKSYGSKYNGDVQNLKSLNFSSATTPLIFQRSIESFVDKRMGSTYGPPGGKKLTVFIDDINMPVINEWGDQITNEITRQLMENSGFYNLEKPGEFTNIVDIQFLGAMIHPGGGRNDIPQRLKRQFSIFNCTLPSENSLDHIFRSISHGYFCAERGFASDLQNIIPNLVRSTREIWNNVKQKMLPTPAKFHYIFNLRDLSRIWQGVLRADSEVIRSKRDLIYLMSHEASRTIGDRFVDQSERDWFNKMTVETINKNFVNDEDKIERLEDCYFADFLRDDPEPSGEEAEEENEPPRFYEQVKSYDQLSERLSKIQVQMNEMVRASNIDLVFFKDAMTHIIKIARVISQPKGHCLLVGVGGSGKQSLTKLASFIVGYKTFQITLTKTYNVTNLADDLKSLFIETGVQGKGITFIFTDNDIKDEIFLEYINNILSTGEISGLFTREERDELLNELIPVMKKEFPRRVPTPENLAEYYFSRVKKYLHLVLCFSPVGDKFRARSLKFPALISGCTIDWFQRWPTDALTAVSQFLLKNFEIEGSGDMKTNLHKVIGSIHDNVAQGCDEYFQRFRRRTHVTPKSYLSFLSIFKSLYQKKYAEIKNLAERMETGLEKLNEATESVNELAKELVVKEKSLEIASQKADEVLTEVTSSATAAEKVKAQVQVVKDKAEAIVASISKDKSYAETKLAAAAPALAEAEAALATIKPAHIATVRKLGKPPHLIMRIMDCVCLLFQRKIDPTSLDPEKSSPKPSWAESLKLMNNSSFLTWLLNFSKDSINDETVELMAPYLDMEDYTFENAKKVCGDVAGLLSWTRAMAKFFSINKEVLPLKANLAIQERKFEIAMKDLNEAQACLDEKQAELDKVQALYDAAMTEKQNLIDDANSCRTKMSNANALIEGLSGEKLRWTKASISYRNQLKALIGDIVLSGAFMSYCGPFNQEFRNHLILEWKRIIIKNDIPFSDDINILHLLVDNTTITEWNIEGLPNDDLSLQNGLITTNSSRYPLLIDPQNQGRAWIKKREAPNNLLVTTLGHKYFRNKLEDALSQGYPILIEDVGEELDPVLDNILEKNFIKSGSSLKVTMGDKEVDVMKGFRLYITTKLSNPAYSPEISARTSIIDFTVTMKGLEDQLLGLVILTEKNELESERSRLLEEVNENKKTMQKLENDLLYRLSSTKGSLVEDNSLIDMLKVSKITAAEVLEKLQTASDTEVKINSAREEFRPVATRGSIAYFLIVEMSMVNVMYQTSLKQFLEIFQHSMDNSTPSPLTQKRIEIIIDYFTFEIFKYSQRGFYESDKFMFTLLLTLKINIQKGLITQSEFEVLIKGGASLDLNSVTPKPKKWILDSTWLNIVALSALPEFSNLPNQVAKNDKDWKEWFDADAPEDMPIPDNYDSSLDLFKKLLLIRCFTLDRTIPMSKRYIAESMGKAYADGSTLDLEAMRRDCKPETPMICFLSMGSDPTETIEKMAKKHSTKCNSISMGQGQEIHARRLLQQSMENGEWILLQNCHLGLNFMDELLQTLTDQTEINEECRIFITTEPHPKFPINLLQTSLKFTFDPPQGMKAGLKRTYSGITQELVDINSYPQWKSLLYATAFLHSIVQERRKFGPIGWNIPYEFNQSDFTASIQYIQNHLDDMDASKGVSWVTVRYMVSEVLYGGRVTDDFDKRLLCTYTAEWFLDAIFQSEFEFYSGYKIPRVKTVEEIREFIDTIPSYDTPGCFGLHPNADISYQTLSSTNLLNTILNIQPKDSSTGSGETRESIVYRISDDMLEKLPAEFVAHEVKSRLNKMNHLRPLIIFLKQEIERMQKVVCLVRTNLIDLKLAIDGTIVMNEDLIDALNSLYDSKVPSIWLRISWEAASLGFWFTELQERYEQLRTWLFHGFPNAYWLTGFFNPQGFLTAMRQEITRNHKGWALDSVHLASEVTKFNSKDEVAQPPAEGCYIYGLYVEGAGWDRRGGRLCEPLPKQLYTQMPLLHVFATTQGQNSSSNAQETQQAAAAAAAKLVYECPVYTKPSRTDRRHVVTLKLRTKEVPSHWILRGVALLCDIK